LEIENYLEVENSPLFNRATAAYNVGSIFKPCVAATGLENKLGDYTYNCTGSCLIAERHFKCHNHNGHGIMSLKTALANSCNTYFYNYAFSLGADPIYKMASSLMFGKSITLCKNFKVSPGNLTTKSKLQNIAGLANFSIGQGELLLSPVSMLTLYTAIANGGSYRAPTLVEGIVNGGEITKEKTKNLTKVMSENTAKLLVLDLKEVVENGTGKTAKPKTVLAAGKTATAQTGKYENSTEIC
jgi:penicillin-binding protein 2